MTIGLVIGAILSVVNGLLSTGKSTLNRRLDSLDGLHELLTLWTGLMTIGLVIGAILSVVNGLLSTGKSTLNRRLDSLDGTLRRPLASDPRTTYLRLGVL